MEQIGIPGAPGASRAYTAPTPAQLTQNLGLGAQRPGGNWYGYTGGPGSMGSFGNTQFGNGMTSVGQWNPQSAWGQQIAASAGSNLDLGNNVGGFIGGPGSGSGGSGLGGSSVAFSEIIWIVRLGMLFHSGQPEGLIKRVHSGPDPAASVVQKADAAFAGPSNHSGKPRLLAWLAEFLQVMELKNSSNQLVSL